MTTFKKISTLGSDIEFMFFDSNNIMIPANSYFGKDVKSPFGTDGADRIAEIRVAPAYNPQELLLNTFIALKHGYNKFPSIQKLQWKAIGDNAAHTVSTHYHCTFKYEKGFGKLCDQIMAHTFILLDNESHSKMRSHLRYCTYSNIRGNGATDNESENSGRATQFQHSGFEYRTIGPVLHSKLATYASFIIFAALIDAYYNHKIKEFRNITLNSEALHNCDKEYFHKQLPAIYEALINLPYFNKYYIGSQYYRDIHNFYQFLINKNWPNPNQRDIRRVWNLDTKINLDNLDKNNKIHIEEIFGIINQER